MSLIIKKFFLHKRNRLVNQKLNLYQNISERIDIEKHQLKSFNSSWGKIQNINHFYKYWKLKHNLPSKIGSLNELADFPILDKKILNEYQDLVFKDNKYSTISTGGSTGMPLKFPYNNFDRDLYYSNMYLGRSWWGISPYDDFISIWGHSHLFGAGIKSKLLVVERKIKDLLLGINRYSAYNLNEKSINDILTSIQKNNGTYIVGYSSAVCKVLLNIKQTNSVKFLRNNLKGVILTSETISDFETNLVKEVLNTNCIIEYGMAEAGVIAFSSPINNFLKVFWDSFILTQINGEAILTTIDNKTFPLINYSTGDILKNYGNEFSILEFEKILGRKHDIIYLYVNDCYIDVHGEIFTHILKSINSIFAFQIVQNENYSIDINYESISNQSIKNIFFELLKREFANLNMDQFRFNRVDSIELTKAGKRKWIINNSTRI
jgi:phenylacetate-coenzyme A ligase PaaK-like adenylate-forming protein